MMVKRGYPRPFAGGVESAASSGGQITPPVMGVGAFIMAEILGIPYLKIAQMAAIPAVLYYVGLGMVVYFEAKKRNLGRLSGSEIPRWRTYWKELLLLLVPVIVLVYLIVMMFSPRFAGFWAVAINIVMFFGLMIPFGKGFSFQKAAGSIKNSGSQIVAGMVEGGGTVATIGVLVAGAQLPERQRSQLAEGPGTRDGWLGLTMSQGGLQPAPAFTKIASFLPKACQ